MLEINSRINTLKYFGATVFITIPLCLVISFFFYKRIAFYKGLRVIFYLPAIILGMVFVTAYTEFIDPNGPLGAIMRSIFGFLSRFTVTVMWEEPGLIISFLAQGFALP